jgi:short-subunit dehydrogenase
VEVDVVAQDLAAPGGAWRGSSTRPSRRDVEVLVNNAGYGMQGRFVDMDMAEVEAMFRLNASRSPS